MAEGKDITEGWTSYENGGMAINAYECKPMESENLLPAVIVLHEIWGLTEHIQDVTRRLAREGYVALAVDYYTRLGERRVAARFSDAGLNLRSTPPEQAVEDVRAAVRFLKATPYVRGESIALLSFSAGSRFAVLSVCPNTEGVAACAAYYPRVIFRGNTDPSWVDPVERLPELGCPLLAFYGEEDQWHSAEDMELFRSALERNGKDYEVVIYPGTGHSFFDDSRKSYVAESAQDSWRRTLAFFGKHLRD